MLQIVASVLGFVFLLASLPAAEQAASATLFERGQRLYQANCALCHQDSGVGDAPTFPALSGNGRLEDLGWIVRNIRQGEGKMPPFPDLTAEEISALANYVRGSWRNDFGSVMTEEVVAIVGGLEGTAPTESVWEGLFTEAQTTRGQAFYASACAMCHGRRLNGAPEDPDMRSTPPLARASFLRNWEGRSLAMLFEYTRATMPENNPGSLTDEEYADTIAYMLSVSGMPAGDRELRPDPTSLSRATIQQRP